MHTYFGLSHTLFERPSHVQQENHKILRAITMAMNPPPPFDPIRLLCVIGAVLELFILWTVTLIPLIDSQLHVCSYPINMYRLIYLCFLRMRDYCTEVSRNEYLVSISRKSKSKLFLQVGLLPTLACHCHCLPLESMKLKSKLFLQLGLLPTLACRWKVWSYHAELYNLVCSLWSVVTFVL